MCDPFSIGTFVAMAGLNFYMGEQQARAENATARYNSRLQEIEASRVANKGIHEENKFRDELQARVSAQRATLAGRGLDVNFGSGLYLQEDQLAAGEADALMIRQNYEDQVESLQMASRNTLLTGKNNARLARIRGVTGGLSGGLSAGAAVAGLR